MSAAFSKLGFANEDHSAFQVRTGMMTGAIQFFIEIGWYELKHRKVVGGWGQARFITQYPAEVHTYQLTELADDDPDQLAMTENHIGLHFSEATPQAAAEAILAWACRSGAAEGASIEAANAEETKWFVYLPALFTFGIEIV